MVNLSWYVNDKQITASRYYASFYCAKVYFTESVNRDLSAFSGYFCYSVNQIVEGRQTRKISGSAAVGMLNF